MRRRVWFQRAFELGLPPDVMPETVERLRGTPLRLEERLAGLAPEVLSARPDGAWSIAEHAGHLADLEPLWLGRVEDLLTGTEVLREADLDNTATWEAGHGERRVEELVARFGGRRRDLLDRLEGLTQADLTVVSLHPRLRQPMSVVDLCFFVAEHDDHHLATITGLRRDAGAEPDAP